jgi:hypothetical protein
LGLIEEDEEFSTMMEQVERGEVDPYSAAQEIFSSESLLQSCLAGVEKEKRKWEQLNR